MQNVSIVGVGNLGGALAIALTRSGWQVDQMIVRDGKVGKRIKRDTIPDAALVDSSKLHKIPSKVVIICVDDPEIAKVAKQIRPLINSSHTVFHTSGSLPSSGLSGLRDRGAKIGSLHPLTSISDPFAGAEQFRGTYFCVEGDAVAAKIGRKIVRSLGGIAFSIDENGKALYHAAAVTAAGHVTALFDAAVQMMELSGVDRKTARKVLIPLVKSTVGNLEKQEPKDALTGTFSRLDLDTFKRHISSFGDLPPKLVHIYLGLGDRSLELVQQRNGESRELDEFRKAVSIAKRKFRC
jgi:predicted short-subunit dehydrogenase-like oxidoreductase (DUF2520 family)